MATNSNGRKTSSPAWPWWLAAAVVTGISFYFDDAVTAFVRAHAGPSWREFGRLGSHFGQWNWLMVPCALAALSLGALGEKDALRILCVMVIASALAGLAADFVHGMTGRARPDALVPQGWHGPFIAGRWAMFVTEYNAFPSAHTAAAVGLIAPLLLMRKRLGWALLPVPIAIAAARICVGAHHLSDVFAGAMLGFAVAMWVQRKIAPRLFRPPSSAFRPSV
ncbi:MAG TPA: phosphatase PAP2 family protein [Chthoniobacteraceae bacterium]|nr:phosphatase PAP2 family protein [Chthoniobacteraceae bacterium]